MKALSLSCIPVLLLGWLIFRQSTAGTRDSYNQLADYENSPSAVVLFGVGGVPNKAHVKVVDLTGNPVVGAKVDIRNNSGGNKAVTDSNGLAFISVGEREVEQITLDGQLVVNRPNAYTLRYPSVENGLRVVILKRDVRRTN